MNKKNQMNWARFYSQTLPHEGAGHSKNIRMKLNVKAIPGTHKVANIFTKNVGGEELLYHISTRPAGSMSIENNYQTSKRIWRIDGAGVTHLLDSRGNIVTMNGTAEQRWEDDNPRFILTNSPNRETQEECNAIRNDGNEDVVDMGRTYVIAPAWHNEWEKCVMADDQFYIENNRVYHYRFLSQDEGELCLVKVKYTENDRPSGEEGPTKLYEFYDFISDKDNDYLMNKDNFLKAMRREYNNTMTYTPTPYLAHFNKLGLTNKLGFGHYKDFDIKAIPVIVEFDKHDSSYYDSIFTRHY